MMVDLGKAQIFKGQMAQAVNGSVRRKFPAAHLLKKFSDGFGVHGLLD
jgi:hypothetical protein